LHQITAERNYRIDNRVVASKMAKSNSQENCRICGRKLQTIGDMYRCPYCDNRDEESLGPLSSSINDFAKDVDKVLIECPGATLYRPGTDEVISGVKFLNDDFPFEYEIVGGAVFGPHHVHHRWVKKEDLHLIRRCQSCQDYTIRMKRKEGANLYIPSRKGPLSTQHH